MSSPEEGPHSRVPLPQPYGRAEWALYATTDPEPLRLVVFVHGFFGKAVKSWDEFADSGFDHPWWAKADMLFVGYRWRTEWPTETADWIRQRIINFYPTLPSSLLEQSGVRLRQRSELPYRELLLVGHSLGGLILRLALLHEGRSWLQKLNVDPRAPRPPILDATLRLFSPASRGFQPGGKLQLLTSAWMWPRLGLLTAPAFRALSPRDSGSQLLKQTQEETQLLVGEHWNELSALRAHTLWARPELVVERDGYRTDHPTKSLIPKRNHRNVCKPTSAYDQPRQFVETGTHL